MGRQSNRGERRRQIVAALRGLISSKGYEAPMSEIARQAGLNQGLLHYHFKSKRDILLTLLDEMVARHASDVVRAIALGGESPVEQLGGFIEMHLTTTELDEETAISLACWVVMANEAARNKQVRDAWEDALEVSLELLMTLIGRGVDQGMFTCDDVPGAAAALGAVIQGYWLMATVAPGVIPPGSPAHTVRRMAAGLLRCEALAP